MSDEIKRVGDGLEEFWKDFAQRHNRHDVSRAFEEGASIWADKPHPNARTTRPTYLSRFRDWDDNRNGR